MNTENNKIEIKCPNCQEIIIKGAKKCRFCSSYIQKSVLVFLKEYILPVAQVLVMLVSLFALYQSFLSYKAALTQYKKANLPVLEISRNYSDVVGQPMGIEVKNNGTGLAFILTAIAVKGGTPPQSNGNFEIKNYNELKVPIRSFCTYQSTSLDAGSCIPAGESRYVFKIIPRHDLFSDEMTKIIEDLTSFTYILQYKSIYDDTFTVINDPTLQSNFGPEYMIDKISKAGSRSSLIIDSLMSSKKNNKK
jgi:hypothetical protein